MTISASRVGPRNITVLFTYGPMSASCTEDYAHLKSSVIPYLTQLVEQIDKEVADAQAVTVGVEPA